MHDHSGHVMSYRAALEAKRELDDELFRSAPESPIPADQRATFPGVPYFPIDEGWRFDGLILEPYEGDAPIHFEMGATRGPTRPAVRAGQFRFEVAGTVHRLVAYRLGSDQEGDPLFVPFMDATTGTETYGAGRYLDVPQADDGTWTLDFNLAYHPSCVYDPRFACPITPPENRLAIRVDVGQRLPPAQD